MIATRFHTASRHLDVFEESWKADHADAMRCHDLEPTLLEGAMVFELVESLNQSWRERVYRGVEPFASEDEQFIKETLARWLRVADEVTADLAKLETKFGAVEYADAIRQRQDRARQTLAKWTSPVLARSPGLRVWDVSEEEADELRELLSAPAGAPGRLKVEPKSIMVGDASILR